MIAQILAWTVLAGLALMLAYGWVDSRRTRAWGVWIALSVVLDWFMPVWACAAAALAVMVLVGGAR